MPAHSVLISPAQGLPACCATAAEPDSSSAVNITSQDRIPVILDSSVKFRKRGSGSIRKPESERSAANRDLVEDIRRVHRDTSGRYGSPRIHAELKARGRGRAVV